MEPESAAHTVLATPELVLLVSAYLAPADLAQCNLVCKDWSRQFGPILWADFSPSICNAGSGDTLPPALTAAMRRNMAHIRILDLSAEDDTTLEALALNLTTPFDDPEQDPSSLCTNLRRLILGNVSVDPTSPHLVALLNHNRLLTHLDLPYGFIESSTVLAAISQLECLQHITVNAYDGAAGCKETLLLLKACLPLPELSELIFLDMELNWDEVDESKDNDMPDAETFIAEASIARFSRCSAATKIKSLRPPSNRCGARNPLPLLLLKSDLQDLESCEIPWFRMDADIEEIEQVVREHCPNLKHLICPCFRGEIEQDGQAVRAFIRGCSGLRSFTSELFSDYDAESFNPKFFNDDYSHLRPRHIIGEVVSTHFRTLEVLDLTDCVQVFSEDQQDILHLCQQLKRFWVTDSYAEGSMVGIESTDICTDYWVCADLRELGIVLNLYPKMEYKFDIMKEGTEEDNEGWDDYDIEELATEATKQVYTQIGQMKKLEVLALDLDRSFENNMKEDDYARNLTISGGWLGELVELKNLRTLHLRADFWSAMGQAEVEFMYMNWPLLNEITVDCNISQMQALPHWQWLLQKRPQLRLRLNSESMI